MMSSNNVESNRKLLLEKAISVANRMHDLLITESEKLNARDEAAIQSLALEKQSCLNELESLGSLLQNISDVSTIEPEEDNLHRESRNKLRAILQRCQQLNHDNQNIAAVEIRHSRQALDLLRSLMNMNDLVLYGEAGDITVSREMRYLGKV